jgi:hypothetical protein
MPPKKKQPARDPARSDAPKPSDKGKQRARAPGTPQQASSSKSGRKSRADRDFEAEEGWVQDNPDPIYQDLAGADPASLAITSEVDKILSIPRSSSPASETNETQPGEEDSDAGAPPSLRAPSPPKLLQPPSRAESTSSVSSRGSKRRREPSPAPSQRRQASRTQYNTTTRGRGRAPSPRRQPNRPTSEATNDEVLQLKIEIHQKDQQLRYERKRNEAQWDLGYLRGRTDGFTDALNLVDPLKKSREEGQPPSTSPREDPDEREARQLRQTMEESKRTARQDSRSQSTHGAGPSRTHSAVASRRPSPGPSSRRRSPPVADSTEPVPEPSTNNRVVRTIGDGYSWADPDSAPIPLSACIPLPTSAVPGQERHTAVISMPPVTPPPEEATSYLELWAGFVTGRALPDALIRIFQARRYALVAGTVRIAVYGYGITRRILKANANTVDKNALHAFLVILAAYQRSQPLLAGVWARVLQRTREQPLNRWNQVRRFLNHPSSSTAAFGITFVAPNGNFEPWSIRTRWTANEFMALLLRIHPSNEALEQLITYADFFVRTRNAGGPLAGHPSVPGLPNDRRFSELFIEAPPSLNTFLPEPEALATASNTPALMEIDSTPHENPAQPSHPSAPTP